jgi:hypothetical protein
MFTVYRLQFGARNQLIYTFLTKDDALYQVHAVLLTLLTLLFGPYRCLYLAYVSFVEQYHAETALTDAATN